MEYNNVISLIEKLKIKENNNEDIQYFEVFSKHNNSLPMWVYICNKYMQSNGKDIMFLKIGPFLSDNKGATIEMIKISLGDIYLFYNFNNKDFINNDIDSILLNIEKFTYNLLVEGNLLKLVQDKYYDLINSQISEITNSFKYLNSRKNLK